MLKLVEAEIAKVSKEYGNVKIDRVFTTVELTKRTYRTALEALIEGSLLAVAVVWIFLRDMRATLISALAIRCRPFRLSPSWTSWASRSTRSACWRCPWWPVVLVDDAIVEIENIVRHMHMGKSGYQASLDAADQIGLAVVATSSAIIAVFLPVSFMGGIVGQFFKQFGLTGGGGGVLLPAGRAAADAGDCGLYVESDHKIHADGR
ncbi:MAG: efflux RND transporter permease subunit [Steroidobacteraceae bacterium]